MATSKQFEYEFLGPAVGPIGVIFGLPIVCYFLVYSCNSNGCLTLFPKFQMPGFVPGTEVFSINGLLAVCGWLTFIALLHLLLPGKRVAGAPLPNNRTLEYKLNGLRCLIVAYAVAIINAFTRGDSTVGWVYDNYIPLLTGACLLSFVLSLFLYASSFTRGKLLAKGGTSGNTVYDFFMGRELNPRIGTFDLKEFCELYPGLIGWTILNFAMAYKQYEKHGHMTASMFLVCFFELAYVFDSLWFEKCILSTMDITTEGFGFMLAFGDLTWVPFTYSLQARYLVDNPVELSWAAIIGIVALHTLGYLVFRGANTQKDIFRQDPNHPAVRHLKTLKTERGRLLMVSGWWGMARHINYLGDWLMGLAWSLPCGFGSVIPYFYPIYFAVLLIHREMRDEHSCRKKYGKDWDKYCSIVKYKIVPYVY